MKRIMPHVGKWFFVVFMAAVIGFLLSLSWSALSRVFPTSLVNQLFGLANFDVAAAAWLLCFIYVARGAVQRSLALVMFLVSMVGVVAVVALEVGISTGVLEIAKVMMPLSITLTVLTVAHVGAIYWFHLNDVDTQHLIEKQADVDETIAQGQKDAQMAMNNMRPKMAKILAANYVDEALRELGIIDLRRDVIDGTVADVPRPAQKAVQPVAAARPGPAMPNWRKWLPRLPGSKTTQRADSVVVLSCLYCGKIIQEGLYCSDAHELEHLQRIERENAARMHKLQAVINGKAEPPVASPNFQADVQRTWDASFSPFEPGASPTKNQG